MTALCKTSVANNVIISIQSQHQWNLIKNCISGPLLPILPSAQMCMTYLCLETSLPMQRSHWHLMLWHFCLGLVSGNSTAITVSMLHSFTKPWRALWSGYTLPKSDQDFHHMQNSEVLWSSSGCIHTFDQFCQVLSREGVGLHEVILDFRQSLIGYDSANPCWTMHHVKLP